MFISHLVDKLEAYDPYGIFRMNGVKALFLAELLFITYYFSNITHPYFYYYYVPLTAIAAECAGHTLSEKYRFLFYTILGATLLIFCYGLMSPYRAFFIVFVLISTISLYHIGLKRDRAMFVAAPIILSLAAYSLIYVESDTNFYIALNHALKTLFAGVVMLVGLMVFPKSFYLNIWQRAFYHYCKEIETISQAILNKKIEHIEIVSPVLTMECYAKMLTTRMPYYSIIRITILAFHLTMGMSYLLNFRDEIDDQHIRLLSGYMHKLADAVKHKSPLNINQNEILRLKEADNLNTLNKLINTWNGICHIV